MPAKGVTLAGPAASSVSSRRPRSSHRAELANAELRRRRVEAVTALTRALDEPAQRYGHRQGRRGERRPVDDLVQQERAGVHSVHVQRVEEGARGLPPPQQRAVDDERPLWTVRGGRARYPARTSCADLEVDD